MRRTISMERSLHHPHAILAPLISDTIRCQMKRFLVSTAALLAGGLIYLLWRVDSLLMFSWCRTIGVDGVIIDWRSAAVAYRSSVPSWVIYSLPQALWLFSGLIMFSVVWSRPSHRQQRVFWTSAFTAMAVILELAQARWAGMGRFDSVDLALLTVAYVVAYVSGGLARE